MISNIIIFKEDKMKQFQLGIRLYHTMRFFFLNFNHQKSRNPKNEVTPFATSMSTRPTLCHYNAMFIII